MSNFAERQPSFRLGLLLGFVASSIGCAQGFDADAFARENASTLCARLLECCDDPTRAASWLTSMPVTIESCEDDYLRLFAPSARNWSDSVANGRMSLDEGARARCLDELRTAACAELDAFLARPPDLCDDVLRGEQDAGELCRSPRECRSGFCASGTCADVATAGQPCTEATLCSGGECRPLFVCAAGAFCDDDTICRAKRAAGEGCSSNGECETAQCDVELGVCTEASPHEPLCGP